MLKADGDYILFIDADTVLQEDTIKAALNEAILEKSDLLTMIPARCANNFIERNLYGFIDWAIYAWLPLQLAHLSKNSYLSASYGQFMLFKRESYILSGGHRKIKDIAVDDFGLGRLIKSSGLKWALKDGTNMVISLPYDDILVPSFNAHFRPELLIKRPSPKSSTAMSLIFLCPPLKI
jgi:glycosyltransferase involved in cell wall biosynthesis